MDYNDEQIQFDDEIVSIEELGEEELVDISVDGDHLFYANGILTKNSWGLPQTVDLQFGLLTNEQLESQNMIMVQQMKNRLKDVTRHRRFLVGINRAKMKLYDVEDPEAGLGPPDAPPPSNENYDRSVIDPLVKYEGIKV